MKKLTALFLGFALVGLVTLLSEFHVDVHETSIGGESYKVLYLENSLRLSSKKRFSYVTPLTTKEQVKQEFSKPGALVLIYHTDWCGVCKEVLPEFDKISLLMRSARFYSMNADNLRLKEHALAKRIKYVPTIYVGHSEDELRNNPCEVKGFTEQELTSGIQACLDGK